MAISTRDTQSAKAFSRAKAAGQEHVFRFWDELPPSKRERLCGQVLSIDFEQLQNLIEQHVRRPNRRVAREQFEPVEYIRLPKSEPELASFREARRAGEELIRQGKVACFVVAGGQGTRLGHSEPKGFYPVGPISGRSLFQFHADKILALQTRYNCVIPWYIMTSEANDAQTRRYFEQNDWLGLDPSDVFFLVQDMVPAVDFSGKLILDEKWHIFTSPNGHGGSIRALFKSGALEDMRSRGIEQISYFQVDNALAKVVDPVFVGFHALHDADMSSKIVQKRDPDEKVGVLGLADGQLSVIEYSELSEEQKNRRHTDGSLVFSAGNMAAHMLRCEFIKGGHPRGGELPYHIAKKVIPYVDDNGGLVNPTAPNGIKFETFVFDALRFAHATTALEVRREEEFSPLKNIDGEDSPISVLRDMQRLFASWLQLAGTQVPWGNDGLPLWKIEINPRFALDAEDLSRKLSSEFVWDRDLLLG